MHRIFLFSLSKQPLINKSLDLPMEAMKEILAANAMVTIVITGKKQNKQKNKHNTLTQEIRLCGPTSILGWRPDADLRVCTEMICFQLPFQSSATMLSSDFQGVEKIMSKSLVCHFAAMPGHAPNYGRRQLCPRLQDAHQQFFPLTKE